MTETFITAPTVSNTTLFIGFILIVVFFIIPIFIGLMGDVPDFIKEMTEEDNDNDKDE